SEHVAGGTGSVRYWREHCPAKHQSDPCRGRDQRSSADAGYRQWKLHFLDPFVRQTNQFQPDVLFRGWAASLSAAVQLRQAAGDCAVKPDATRSRPAEYLAEL